MKSLLKVSKLLPKLGTSNPHEKMATLSAIERILLSEGVSWTDAGLKLGEFLTQIAGISEEEALAPPVEPEKKKGWSQSATPAPAPQAPPFQQQQYRPQPAPQRSPPPPRPAFKPIDPRCWGTDVDKEALVQELLIKKLWKTIGERDVLLSLSMLAMSGLPFSAAQQRMLEKISQRL